MVVGGDDGDLLALSVDVGDAVEGVDGDALDGHALVDAVDVEVQLALGVHEDAGGLAGAQLIEVGPEAVAAHPGTVAEHAVAADDDGVLL